MDVKRYFRRKQQQKRGGSSPLTELENLQVLLAFYFNHTTPEEAAKFIGCTEGELMPMFNRAMYAGKELVK